MNRTHPIHRALATLIAGWLAVSPLGAWADASHSAAPAGSALVAASADSTASTAPAAAPARSGDLQSDSLATAREMIRGGHYNDAIEILTPTIEREKRRVEILREAYVLLIQSYVYQGNAFRLSQENRLQSGLNYDKARDLIAQALAVPQLRHLQAPPFPPEMAQFFAEVRSKKLGSFRVENLSPPGAVVLLDADTLRAFPGDSLPGDVDIALGAHLVTVRAPGYKDVTDEIQIDPGTTLSRSYNLPKRHGGVWYATRAGGAAAVVTGAILLVPKKKNKPEQPLPEAPGPPSMRTAR